MIGASSKSGAGLRRLPEAGALAERHEHGAEASHRRRRGCAVAPNAGTIASSTGSASVGAQLPGGSCGVRALYS